MDELYCAFFEVELSRIALNQPKNFEHEMILQYIFSISINF